MSCSYLEELEEIWAYVLQLTRLSRGLGVTQEAIRKRKRPHRLAVTGLFKMAERVLSATTTSI